MTSQAQASSAAQAKPKAAAKVAAPKIPAPKATESTSSTLGAKDTMGKDNASAKSQSVDAKPKASTLGAVPTLTLTTGNSVHEQRLKTESRRVKQKAFVASWHFAVVVVRTPVVVLRHHHHGADSSDWCLILTTSVGVGLVRFVDRYEEKAASRARRERARHLNIMLSQKRRRTYVSRNCQGPFFECRGVCGFEALLRL